MDRVVNEVVPIVRAWVPGDDLGPAADDHYVDVAPNQHVPVSVGHWHRVVVGPVPYQRQGTDPARLFLAGVVCCCRQRQQGVQVPLHPLTDGLPVFPELGVRSFHASSLQVGIERIKALEGRYGNQEVSAHVSHQSLHLAFVVALAGAAEPVLEPVVGLEIGEGAGALTPAIPQDLRHRQLGIVVEDALGHSAQKGERRYVAI